MSCRVELARPVRGRISKAVSRRLEHRLRRAGAHVQPPSARGRWTVRICDDDEIARLHERHMHERGPTDVLSFPALPVPGGDDLGDVVLSWDAVLRQSRAADEVAWLEEATQLSLHGLAHLLRHDHDTRRRARAMLRTETRAARAAGAMVPVRPYGR